MPAKHVLWLASRDPKKPGRAIVLHQALTATGRGPATVAFTSDLLTDFPDWQRPGEVATQLNFSRLALYRYPKQGYVAIVSVFAGERYQPGKHPLLPVVFSSPDGSAGSWRCHGRLNGDPLVVEQQRRVWSDNGGVVPLADGRWRVYLNGYGATIAAAESDSLDGPWTFVRQSDGTLKNIGDAYKPVGADPGGAIFPFVTQVSAKEYHMWLSQGWPVRGVHHLVSTDGLNFRPHGPQPFLTREQVGTSMKGVRAFLSADGTKLRAWIPLWKQQRWQIHAADLPTGQQLTLPD